MRNQKGITLIALVITIIVLLILVGVAIAMLTGDNGIITNAQASRSNTAFRAADEQMRLAYMAVRTEIAARLANDTAYEATSLANAKKLEEIVNNDLQGFTGNNSSWEVKLELDKDGVTATGIFMKCTAAAILQATESEEPLHPLTDGKVCGRINLKPRTATYDFDQVDILDKKDEGTTGNTTNTTNTEATDDTTNTTTGD